MLSIYNYMASGVLLTGIIALLVSSNPSLLSVFFAQKANGAFGPTILGWIAMLSPLALILVMNFGINKLSEGPLKATFWAFAALMGVSLSTIFLAYTGASIARPSSLRRPASVRSACMAIRRSGTCRRSASSCSWASSAS